MTQAGDLNEPATWPPALRKAMACLPETGSVYIALSGGLDSVFLLHVAFHWYRHASNEDGRRVDVRAIHVNHNMNAGAGRMEQVCRQHCDRLNIPLIHRSVDVPATNASRENNARHARYQAFTGLLKSGDLLLMAHHRDDQAETVLFRLLRGTGVRGLAGMPRKRRLGRGTLMRPLLDISRNEICKWAQVWGLDWTEDPSNTDCTFDRNFLRHKILPSIETRWPGFRATIANAARHAAESEYLNERLARLQLGDIEDAHSRLNVTRLNALSGCEQRNILRFWIRGRDFQPPGAAKLTQGVQDLMIAENDRTPALVSEGYSIRRFRGYLYLVPEHPEPSDESMIWQPAEPVAWGSGRLRLEGRAEPDMVFRITRRQGGERFRPHAGGSSRSVKKWLQEQAVPPWERNRLPLVWLHNELVAIGHLWSLPNTVERGSGTQWRVIWESSER